MSISQLEKPTAKSSAVVDRSSTPTPTRIPARSRTGLRPAEKPQSPRTTRPAPAPRPAELDPRIVEGVRSSIQQRALAGLRILCIRVALFVGVFSTTYLVDTLYGQVQMEAARRQEMNATGRARAAHHAEAGLRREIDALTSGPAIERWASTHGFVAPDAVTAKAPAQASVKVKKGVHLKPEDDPEA